MPRRASAAQRVLAAARSSFPCAGVTRGDLDDTWGQARSKAAARRHRHHGAARARPCVAAADGRIVKFFDSERGGITIYQFDAQRAVRLLLRAPERARAGLAEGDDVRQGDVIGYVGMTRQRADAASAFRDPAPPAERHWWRATSLNPYPYLHVGRPPA